MRVLLPLLAFGFVGCQASEKLREYQPPPPPNFVCKELPFDDSDAFDAALKLHLSNGAPVVRVLLDSPRPDWPPRLVAWLDAYRAGGKVRPPSGKGVAALAWLGALSGSPTEARQLLESSLDRIAVAGAAVARQVARAQDQAERTALLAGYVLDADQDAARGGLFTLVLYNGRYGP